MKLWLISQTANSGYDTFDSAVMAAESAEEARMMKPGHSEFDEWKCSDKWGSWAYNTEDVTVNYIGEAATGTPRSQIIASFNAG